MSGFRSDLFRERVVVVTGGAQGIGAAVATEAARLGARVAICDRRAEVLDATAARLRATGADVLASVTDVRDTEAVAAFVDDIAARFGAVHVLVNNAGGSFAAPFLDASPKGEHMLIAENFTQITDLVRRCVPLMPPGSSIVTVTSVEAHQAAPQFAIYAAMKAAAASLTRSLALELAPLGIRVNAMAPDALASGGEEDARSEATAGDWLYRPAMVPPLGHLGRPEDGANAVLFLASPLAAFVTGTTVHVDGGTWAAGGWQRTAAPAPEAAQPT